MPYLVYMADLSNILMSSIPSIGAGTVDFNHDARTMAFEAVLV